MKNITIVLDGSADRANPNLDNKTPLEAAHTPALDALFKKSLSGTVRTIPEGMEVGSAVANLSLLGFDPATYRGRAIIEAAGLGLPLNQDDMYIRCNMVTFEGNSFAESKIKSYSAYDIATEVAAPVMEELSRTVFGGEFALHYCGSFRNILIVKGGKALYPIDFEPAHDIIGQPIAPFIKEDGKQAEFFDLMMQAYDFLKDKNIPANGLWFWGASVMPEIKGDTAGRAALSETLLMDGITTIAGLPNIGTVREGRDFPEFLREKLEHALRAADEYDDIYIHIQETDDLSHELEPVKKKEALEQIDSLFLEPFLQSLHGDYTISLASDHFTFSDTGSHGGDPVPFLFYDSANEQDAEGRFTEKDCQSRNYTITAKDLKKMQKKV